MLKVQTERVLKTEVSEELHRRVRVRAAEQDVSIARYVARAVREKIDAEDARGAEDDGHTG